MRTHPLGLALLVAAFAVLAWGQGSREDGRDALYAVLRSEDTPRREAAARAILEERRLLIDVLCEIVHEKTAGDYDYQKRRVAESAIRLLGQIRAAEAAPLLAKNLLFTKPSGPGLAPPSPPIPFHKEKTAIVALIEIGTPSIAPMLQEVEASDDPSLMRGVALTLNCILETDPALALIDARSKDLNIDRDIARRLQRLRKQIDENERRWTEEYRKQLGME